MLQGRIWSHLEASFTSPYVSLPTLGSITCTEGILDIEEPDMDSIGVYEAS